MRPKPGFWSARILLGLLACRFAAFSICLGAQMSDLELRVQQPSSLAVVGELVSLRLAVTNHGPDAASGVTLTNVCSTNALVFSASPSQGSCMPFSGGVRCDLGTVPPGTEAIVTIALTPQSHGPVSLASHVASGGVDPVPVNNSAKANFTAVPTTFHPGPNLVIGRQGHAAALLADGRVLIVGGATATGHTATVEIFDTNSGLFRLTRSMRTTREHPTATVLTNGRVLVVGGERAELFDPATEEFIDVGPTVKTRWGHAAALLRDGRVLITGGADPLDTYWSPAAEVYHPGSNAFSRVGDMIHGRYFHSSARLADGGILIAGGSGAADFAEIFHSQSNRFFATGNMVAGNWWPTLTLLPSGRMLVAKPYGPAPNSEIYDPASGFFSAAGDPSRPVKAETATLLADGRVLVCPGSPAELYDPATERFSNTVPFIKNRTGFTATRLHDGRVLVVGGDETTEFYVPDQVKLLPAISVSDAVFPEGNSSNNVVAFSLQLAYPMAVPVVVGYFLSPGTAEWYSGDFDPITSTSVFPPGSTNTTLSVNLHGDPDFEMDEFFTVNLYNPSNAVLGRAQATGTILNDDPVPAVSVADAQAFERSTTLALPIPVFLSSASVQPVTVRFSTLDGTALAGADYFPQQGELIFPPGTKTQFVNVAIRGDIAIEPDELFYLTLHSVSNGTLGQAQATITILNDDGLPGRLHHFEFEPIPTTQYVGRAIPVQVTARDFDGNLASNFTQRVAFNAASADDPGYWFHFETNGLDDWTPLNAGYSPGPYETSYFDVNGDGAASLAFRLTPDYDTPPDGLTRQVYLRGGIPYSVSTDLALRNDSEYPNPIEAAAQLRVGSTLLGSANLTGYGYAADLWPGYTYHTRIIGSFEAPTNGFYPIEISFTGYAGDPNFWVYADDIRLQFPALTLLGTNWFTNGVWAGDVLFTNQASGVALEVMHPEGYSGASSGFDVQPQTDLALLTGVFALVPNVGYPQTLTITVTNRGPLAAPNVKLTNTLDGVISILSATSSVGACGVVSNLVTCSLGSLTNGQRATVTVIVSSPVTSWITNTASISSSLADAFAENNTVTTPLLINPAPIYLANSSITEPENGTTNAIVRVFLEHPSAEWISVDYSTSPGTALAGLDFLSATGASHFRARLRTSSSRCKFWETTLTKLASPSPFAFQTLRTR